MSFPSALEVVLLAAAAWRIWHLVAEDTILERPRRWLFRQGDEWEKDGDPVPDDYRFGVHEFVQCPFCMGFWVSLGWVGFYALWPEGAVWAALPFALNMVVVAVNHWLTAEG